MRIVVRFCIKLQTEGTEILSTKPYPAPVFINIMNNAKITKGINSSFQSNKHQVKNWGGMLDSVDIFSIACLPAGRSADSKIYT
mgnify:FL=1